MVTVAAELAGMPIADAGKQFSEVSIATLNKLGTLYKKLEGITERMEEAAAVQPMEETECSADDLIRLIKAKNDLAQVAGDLEKLQSQELDAVQTAELTSGKDTARSRRKNLNLAVDNLMTRTHELHKDFAALVKRLQEEASPAEPVSKTTSVSSSPLSSKSPLSIVLDSSPASVNMDREEMSPAPVNTDREEMSPASVNTIREEVSPASVNTDRKETSSTSIPIYISEPTHVSDAAKRPRINSRREKLTSTHQEPVLQIPSLVYEEPHSSAFYGGYPGGRSYYMNARAPPQRLNPYQRQQVLPSRNHRHTGFYF
jgi:hypothetical protein